jgi:hypothetical protein
MGDNLLHYGRCCSLLCDTKIDFQYTDINVKGDGIIQLRKKLPQTNSKRHSELITSDWIELREPQNLVSSVLAVMPLMILSTLFSFIILNLFSPFSLEEFGINSSQDIEITISFLDLVYFLGLSIIIVLFHEIIHLAFVPDFLTSDKAFLGITYFGGFAYFEDVLSKSRFILILLAPFIAISIMLPGILGALNLLSPLVKFVILSNAMGSGVDILGLTLILIQVPAGAYLTCNGMKTYWKKIDSSIPESI